MSVRLFTWREIDALKGEIAGLRDRVGLCADDEALRTALAAAWLANASAFVFTYGENLTIEAKKMVFSQEPARNADRRAVYGEIGLLLYNCVSNDGTDFLPANHKAVLEGVREVIAEHLIRACRER